jgi:epoxyqueuosine reductase
MTISISEPQRRRAAVLEKARELGFDAAGIASAEAPSERRDRLFAFLAVGRHGDMGWMAERAEQRADPKTLWPDAKSVVMLGLNYGPNRDPLKALADREAGAVSVYAQRRDYHDVMKPRLKALGRWLVAAEGGDVKVFVDTAPVMEKPLAEAAGLGWQGKHTNLVSRPLGSWLFLGAVFSTLDLAADAPETDHCGACRRCLDICPTGAFPQPYQLDARRCVSYLTIEHKGPIPRELRPALGNRIYGCDDCLAVCPWNKFAKLAADAALQARDELAAPRLDDLLRLDDSAFRRLFAGSPVKRTGRDRFLRNVLIAAGNSGNTGLAGLVRVLMNDASPLVRGAAIWALARLEGEAALKKMSSLRAAETDETVLAEWAAESQGGS